jgi:ribosomal protein S18 acetylase RimI-like enzyme
VPECRGWAGGGRAGSCTDDREQLRVPSVMLIRPATAADVPHILPMVRAICGIHRAMDSDKYDFLPDIEARYSRWLPERAADPRSVFLVAVSDEPIGFLVATIEAEIPIYSLSAFGFIHDVWVEPAYRGGGVGRHLVDSAVARFSELGVKQVRLDTALVNEPARRLFASSGFRPSTIEMLRVISP